MVCKIGLSIIGFGRAHQRDHQRLLSSLMTVRDVRLTNRRSLTNNTKSAWNILFFGTDSFAVESLHMLNTNRVQGVPKLVENLDVVCSPSKGIPLPVQQYVIDNKLVLHEWPCSVPLGKYDLGVVASFGHLIPTEIIDSFPLGMINVHGSLLPRWRGAAPIVHAILNDDKVAGVTIMEIAPHRFDIGKILLQQSFEMPERVTASILTRRIATVGAQLLLQCLGDLETVLAHGITQDPAQVTQAPKIKPEQARLKWSVHTISDVDKMYRALDENFKLYSYWHGHQVRLTNMVDVNETRQHVSMDRRFSEQLHSLASGKVVYSRTRKSLFIMCKDGWAEFKSVTVKGKAKMSAADFYNGYISKVVPDLQLFRSDNKTVE